MLVGVPVLVEHVVAHDEANGAVRQFIVDQHAFLMVARRQFQHFTHGYADFRVEAFVFYPAVNLGPFVPTETTTDEQRMPCFGKQGRLAVRDLASGKPLAVVVVLRLGRALQRTIGNPNRPLAGQVGLSHHTRSIERILPAQHSNLDPFTGQRHEQLANARGVAIADKIHRRLKAPTDDINGLFGLSNGQVHGLEGFLAIDQGHVTGRYRVVFGVADEPG
ncbi:hypothetical protein D3C81_1497830 [compost metagenome]